MEFTIAIDTGFPSTAASMSTSTVHCAVYVLLALSFHKGILYPDSLAKYALPFLGYLALPSCGVALHIAAYFLKQACLDPLAGLPVF